MTPSDSIEATAATVDEAISQALDQLGAHSDDVTIEVLSTPRSGVLGLGVRLARVRVTRHTPAVARSAVQSPPPAPPLKRTPPELSRQSAPGPERPPAPDPEVRTSTAAKPGVGPAEPSAGHADQERTAARASDSHPSEGRRRNDSRTDPDDGPRRESPREPSNEGRRRDSRADSRRDDRPRRDRAPQAAEDSRENRVENRSEGRADTRRDGESRGDEPRADNAPRSRRTDANDRPRRAEAAPPPRAELEADFDAFNDDGSDGDQRDLAAPEEQVNEAIKITSEILAMMGEKATIETVRDEGLQAVELNIRGDGSGILIGRHGQTLDALEYIVNRILGRRIKDALAISIDTESYRARRRSQLHRMALSKGEQAKREHITVRLDPMPPRDRRIVHLALKDDPLITTRSFGEGFLRSIEIVPVDGPGDRDRNERGSRDRRGRGRDVAAEREDDDLPLGQQGGFKHGQKRIV
jgi:spoIIIJ-associated protein